VLASSSPQFLAIVLFSYSQQLFYFYKTNVRIIIGLKIKNQVPQCVRKVKTAGIVDSLPQS
jgi:hypothetical protein